MKTKLTISILLLFMNTFAQLSKDSGLDSVVPKPTTLIQHINTSTQINSDSFIIQKIPEGNSTVKVLLTKKDDADGWFVKYAYPVVLVLVGIMIPLFLDSFRDRKRIRKVGERWTSEIRFLEMPITNQIEAIEKYLLIHNQNNLTFPDFQIIEGLDCEIFKSLDKSELLKFLEQNKTSNYREAVRQSNYINTYINIVKGLNANLRL